MHTKLYFGTYTRGKSKGIYQAYLNEDEGKLLNLENIIEIQSPSYLARSKNHLFSILKEEQKGGIACFNKDKKLISKVLLDGPPLCHIAVDERRQLAFGANYHKGQITLYKYNHKGSIILSDLVQLEGSGPHPNQEKSHLHYVGLSPDQYLVTCDLGTDSIRSYKLIDNNCKLEKIAQYQSQAGAGSRHLVFHPNEKIAYLLCELNSTVEVLIYNGYGHFECLQIISTLPEGYQDFNATAAIRISDDGNFLYTSNRCHNSIAIFKIKRDGQLQLLDIVSSAGNHPRDFNISPSQEYLVVAHQESDNASLFRRDLKTGLLTLLDDTFYLPEAICVSFDK